MSTRRDNKSIYRIKILNWHKHNPNRKNHYKYTMIANNFLRDAKICALPVTVQRLFLGVLLTCGDQASDVVALSQQQVSNLLATDYGPVRALSLLQSFQLLTFEKIDSFELIKEEKEEKGGDKVSPEGAPPSRTFSFEENQTAEDAWFWLPPKIRKSITEKFRECSEQWMQNQLEAAYSHYAGSEKRPRNEKQWAACIERWLLRAQKYEKNDLNGSRGVTDVSTSN